MQEHKHAVCKIVKMTSVITIYWQN